MKKLFSLSIIFILLLSGCTDTGSNTGIDKVNTIVSEIKAEYAPDGRDRTFEIKVSEKEGAYIFKGVTTESNAKDALLKKMEENGIKALDSIKLLPDAALGEKNWGLTSHSVINLRTSPSYAAESATQTVMGTPLRILEKRGGWSRVKTPEGYIAWVTSGSVVGMTEEQLNAWKKSKRYIITTHYTLLVDKPNEKGIVVSDGVWGNIIESAGAVQGDYIPVKLPDGRKAYLLKYHAEEFVKWLGSRKPTPESIIATAKQFMGFPYMWGGTSIKAMDCSGFTKTTYYLNGIILRRDASQQGYTGDNIDISGSGDNAYNLGNLKKGDLIFFGRKATADSRERLTHVGIYIGDGVFIHSATSVRINSLKKEAPDYYEGSTRFIRAQRILGNVDQNKGIVSIKKHPWYF